MAASIHSLANETLLHILTYLPRPVLDGQRPVPPRCPLLCTSLVDKRLSLLSQRVLFDEVQLSGKGEVQQWMKTDARQWTTKLCIAVAPTDSHKDREWLNNAVAVAFNASEITTTSLKWFQLTGASDDELGAEWWSLPGFKGKSMNEQMRTVDPGVTDATRFGLADLSHIQVEQFRWPSSPSANHSSLRRLNVSSLESPLDGNPPSFPIFGNLTHLHLEATGAGLIPLNLAFPNLTHLSVINFRDLHLGHSPKLVDEFASSLPKTITHFATRSRIVPEVLEALPLLVSLACWSPARFAGMRIPSGSVTSLEVIVDHCCPGGVRDESVRLRSIALTNSSRSALSLSGDELGRVETLRGQGAMSSSSTSTT